MHVLTHNDNVVKSANPTCGARDVRQEEFAAAVAGGGAGKDDVGEGGQGLVQAGGLALFTTLFGSQTTVQMMTAGMCDGRHVTNLTPPGSDNLTCRWGVVKEAAAGAAAAGAGRRR
jgi:hypothetical protein